MSFYPRSRRSIIISAFYILVLNVVLYVAAACEFPNLLHVIPWIHNVALSSTAIARFDKLEVAFDVDTVASTLDLPFDPQPPPGVQPRTGISVDALLSPDGGKTTIVQPAFLYQPYSVTMREGRDHLTPQGAPHWMVRFTPQQEGNWQLRLRAQDASGSIVYPPSPAPPLTFNVQGESSDPYRRRGFIRVSQSDRRYFEFQDGTPFVGVGFAGAFTTTESAELKLQQYEDSKINFLRLWLSAAGINGSQWPEWESGSGFHFDIRHTFNGADLSLKLDKTNPCLMGGFYRGTAPVEPNTAYALLARVKLNGVIATTSSAPAGFLVKHSMWLGEDCDKAKGMAITPPLLGTTDWITTTGVITTGPDQYWLDYLYLARQNAQGEVYIDEVRMWRVDDTAQANLLRQPRADSHIYFDDVGAFQWDNVVETAGRHGVYLKVVVDEKNEWIKNHINAAGAVTDAGSNSNFYAAPNTKVRWLQQAWWRYIIARWGYSAAIHSFEYVNEGDPYNGNHYEAANALAQYVHRNDPSGHLVTTSFWHSFPNKEFWSNPQYSDIDYADIHAYVSTGWGATAAFTDPLRVIVHPSPLFSGNALHLNAKEKLSSWITPRGVLLRGPGEWILKYWMKANAFTVACPFGGTGGMQRVIWQLDGGKTAVVPTNQEHKEFICTSPAGTFDWKEFRSDRDRDGKLLPEASRIILTDDKPQEIAIRIENSNGTGGEVWIGGIQLISPKGQVVPVLGQFDITPLDEDTAWFNRAYGDLWGAASPVGAPMPLVRGETGIDYLNKQEPNRTLISDTNGIWLHNNIWGQVNPGGMYDLMWWPIPPTIFSNYQTYRNFMDNIPLNNGSYHDLGARTTNANLRAWGQRDDKNGRLHVWIQNLQHTWKRVVAGSAIAPLSGSIAIPDVPKGNYCVTWWNTYQIANPIFLTQTLSATDALTLTLPFPLQDDVAVQARRLDGKGTC